MSERETQIQRLPVLPDLQDGDIIGFSGAHFKSDLINLATYGWPRYGLSHIGILARKNKRCKWLVFEANEDVPWQCAVTHRKHDGIQAHSLDLLLERYQGKIWHYPLNHKAAPRSYHFIVSLFGLQFYNALCDELGIPYDWAGARRAGGMLWACLQSCFCQEDTSAFFCSEFVATKLREFGLFTTNNVSKWSPNRLVRKLVRKGLYKPAARLK